MAELIFLDLVSRFPHLGQPGALQNLLPLPPLPSAACAEHGLWRLLCLLALRIFICKVEIVLVKMASWGLGNSNRWASKGCSTGPGPWGAVLIAPLCYSFPNLLLSLQELRNSRALRVH